MTDSFLIQLCTVRYDHKPLKKTRSQNLTYYFEQKHHQDFFEVLRNAGPKHHTKYKCLRQTINHVDTLILI